MAKQDKEQNNTKKLEEQLIDMENQLKRAVADYRNLEKRLYDDVGIMVSNSKTELIKKILPVLDSLDQAVLGASESEANSGWLKGVLMAIASLRKVLSEDGLVEIPTDRPFDPNIHEAVDIQAGEDGKILKVVVRGYTLNERVVRPARVIVGKSQKEDK